MASKITKRKLDDAIDRLDSVLSSSPDETAVQPSPSKKPNTSIYASLSRYNLFKSSSSRSPTQQSPAISLPFALSSKPPYRPESTQDFLARLSTFRLTTYRDKPDPINAVAASKSGWTNDGKDRLVCCYCNASFALAPTKGMANDAANALVERQRQGLVTNHKDFCPWRKAQCDDSVYRIPLQRPTALAKQLRARAELLSPLVRNIAVSHPLTATELNLLLDTLSALSLIDKHDDDAPAADSGYNSLSRASAVQGLEEHAPTNNNTDPISDNAAILSLFGWETLPTHHSQPPASWLSRAPSISRATSPAASRGPTPPSSPLPRVARLQQRHSTSLSKSSDQDPTLQRTSSFTSLSSNKARHPRSSLPPRLSLGSAVPEGEAVVSSLPPSPEAKRKASASSKLSTDFTKDSNAVVWCEMCQRRVGLWAFTAPSRPSPAPEADVAPVSGENQVVLEETDVAHRAPTSSRPSLSSRQLDVVREHRSFCPYVTKSTSLPTPVFSVPLLPSTTGSLSSTKSRKSISSRLSLSSSSPPSSPSSQPTSKSSGGGGNDLMEGWKAVLTIIGRSGIGMKTRRTGSSLPSSKGKENGSIGRSASVSFRMPCVGGSGASEEDAMEVDDQDKGGAIGVDKIVDNVKKTREGSRELLRYVKDLLRRGSDSGPHPMVSSTSNTINLSDPINPNPPAPSTPPATATAS